MALNLSTLTAAKIRRSFPWGDETVEFTYSPGAHTAAFEAKIAAAAEANDSVALAGMLAELVSWVDVVDDGVPIECTPQVFAEVLPQPFLLAMWKACGEASRVDPLSNGTSAAG